MERVSKYILRTNRKGLKAVLLENDPRYADKLAREKADTLKQIEPRTDIPSEARCFHENKEYFGTGADDFEQGIVNPKLVVLEVPMQIENEYGEIVDNDLGIIELDKASDVILLMNYIRQGTGDLTVGLMPYSKKLTAAELKEIKSLPGVMTEKSDVDKRRKMKINGR